MRKFTEVKGNLITMAQQGHFEVISHGANCFCMMGAGIALPMRQYFSCDKFQLEQEKYKGDYNKLGQIDYEVVNRKTGLIFNDFDALLSVEGDVIENSLVVVNSYTQYHGGANLNYTALQMCLDKLNHTFKDRHIGLPLIGGGIAGGDPEIIKQMMKKTLVDVDVTLVLFDK